MNSPAEERRSPVQEHRSSVEDSARHSAGSLVLRGILAVIFGLIALRVPNLAVRSLVIVFAVYAFADGILDFYLAARLARSGQRWGWNVFEGIVSIAIGVIALAYPGVTILAVTFLVAIRAVAVGIFELLAAFSWEVDSRWLLGITGALSVVFGIMLFANPTAGALALLWAIAIYAIVFGVMLFALGLHIHSANSRVARLGPPAAAGH